MDSATEISIKQLLELKNSELIEQSRQEQVLESELLKTKKLIEALQRSNDANKHMYMTLYDEEMQKTTQLLQKCTTLQNQYNETVNRSMIEKQTLYNELEKKKCQIDLIRKENEEIARMKKYVKMKKEYKILKMKFGSLQNQLDEVLKNYEQCRSEQLAENQKSQKKLEDLKRKLKELENKNEKLKVIEKLKRKHETQRSFKDVLSRNRSLDTSRKDLAVNLAIKPCLEEPSDDCVKAILAEMMHVRDIVTPLPCTEPALSSHNEAEILHRKTLVRRTSKKRLHQESLRRLSKIQRPAYPTLSMTCAAGESTDFLLEGRLNVPDKPSELTLPFACDNKSPLPCILESPTLSDPMTPRCEEPSEAALEIILPEKLPKSNNRL